ncbi:MAG: nucleotidyltransferase domain-containing protein [Anaerolineae bacterium]
MTNVENPFERRSFTPEDRQSIQDRLLANAHEDSRIVAGALLGSLALGKGDRWSDLDLSFGVAAGSNLDAVLEDWTLFMAREFAAVQLFDLPYLTSIYRVFLLPNNLQIDLSFTPASDFGAFGPKFALLFGSAVEKSQMPKPSAQHLFGLAVHHALRARLCVERQLLWQAEYWISDLRDTAFALAALHRGLEAREGRGFDKLPVETLALGSAALVLAIEREELLRALDAAVELLLHEAADVREAASTLERQLRDLTAKE